MVSIIREKALTLIVCGLSILCGMGWGWDEGLIDCCCDWQCNPSLPPSLPLCVTAHNLDYFSTEHTAETHTGCLKRPDVWWRMN